MKKVLFIGFTPVQTGLARKFLIFRNLASEIEIVAEQQSSVGVVGYVVNGDDPSSPARLALHLRLNPRPALGVGGIAVQGITAFVGGAFKPATADRLAGLLLMAGGAAAGQPSPVPTGNVVAFPGVAAAPDADVLVVDDSEIVQRTMMRKITEYGQRVDVASNGNDALAMLQGTAYKLIFLDVLMPGMDGFEVCKKIKKSAEYKTSAVYMLSSKDGMFDKVRGTLAGCNGYLVKPLEARKLRAVLDRHFVRPSHFRESAFADSRMFSESRMADSRFPPSQSPPSRLPSIPMPTIMSPAQALRASFDNEKSLEPYRAEISNAFAATQPAPMEDMPDYKAPSSGRRG